LLSGAIYIAKESSIKVLPGISGSASPDELSSLPPKYSAHMILYLLIDLSEEDWGLTTRNIFNDLVVFLNAYHRSSRSNRIVVISGREVLFDTSKDDICDIYRMVASGHSYTVDDLGRALCMHREQRARILIFTLREEDKREYLRYLKCMFTAQRFKTRIDAFCLLGNQMISQCCASSNGRYSASEEECLRFLISLLGSDEGGRPMSFPTKCYCHNRVILLGLVCPICLSVYCSFLPVCKRCKSKFSFIK
jgi:transcription initiation factor TFIIH subunit 3